MSDRGRRAALALMIIVALIVTIGPFLRTPAPHPVVATAAAVTSPQPHGPAGTWKLVWRDEFTWKWVKAPPDPAKWTRPNWHVQNVDMKADNAWVEHGHLVLNLSSVTTGGMVRSKFYLKPGMVVEARVRFPGSDTGDHIFNFPAWWVAGVVYPDAGEHDIAEGLRGDLFSSYWDRTKTRTFKRQMLGDLNNAYHIFTLKRGFHSAAVYLDGTWLWSYPTNDNGGAEALILSLGSPLPSWDQAPVLGKPGQVLTDWVRLFERS